MEAGAFQLAPHGRADLAAALDVLDPEFAYGPVGVAQSEAVGGLGMGEAGGVEVELELLFIGPVDPAAEVVGLDLRAVDRAAAELAVNGVQVQPMGPRDEGESPVEILAELGRRAGFAGMVPRHLQAAAGERTPPLFESAHVVPLPAMNRERDFLQGFEGLLGVHALPGIGFFGRLEAFFNGLRVHSFLPVISANRP